MTNDSSYSEQVLRDKVGEGGFAVALSGGGHRASLATIGALMAIVDRGLGGKVMQIASVSGGSITNAFVAQRCDFGKLERFGLDDIATELTATIVRNGVLSNKWITFIFIAPILTGVAVGYGFYTLILPWTTLSMVLGFCTALVMLLCRGLLVEWLLDRSFFRHSKDKESARGRARKLLKSISGTSVDHVFCMTDLVLGLPVYASSQHGGIMYRRLSFQKQKCERYDFQTFDVGQMSLAEIVRASAAFPGIPARRKVFPEDEQNLIVAKNPAIGYLADGGIWNNLGSQVLREDQILFTHFAWGGKAIRPHGLAPGGIPLLCINGSAPLRSTQSWAFKVPGVALVKSIIQIANILNANTVQPRVQAMKESYLRRVYHKERSNAADPADLVVDLKPSDQVTKEYYRAAWGVDDIAQTDFTVKNWESNVVSSVRHALDSIKNGSDHDWTQYILRNHADEPKGSYPACGLASFDDTEALRLNSDWKQLADEYGSGDVDAPTTLARIDSHMARRLIGRSYLNTFYVSLFLAPLSSGELDSLQLLSKRIEKIVSDASL